MVWFRVGVVTTGRPSGRRGAVRRFIGEPYGHNLHVKHIDAPADATPGVVIGASPADAMTGQVMAWARSLVTRQAVKLKPGMTGTDGHPERWRWV